MFFIAFRNMQTYESTNISPPKKNILKLSLTQGILAISRLEESSFDYDTYHSMNF